MPTTDSSHHARWPASPRGRRIDVARPPRRFRALWGAILVGLASLALAGGAATASGAERPSGHRSETVAAVQRALGIPADGIAGRQTRRAGDVDAAAARRRRPSGVVGRIRCRHG